MDVEGSPEAAGDTHERKRGWRGMAEALQQGGGQENKVLVMQAAMQAALSTWLFPKQFYQAPVGTHWF